MGRIVKRTTPASTSQTASVTLNYEVLNLGLVHKKSDQALGIGRVVDGAISVHITVFLVRRRTRKSMYLSVFSVIGASENICKGETEVLTASQADPLDQALHEKHEIPG